ncbi:MAG TPA: hypothetical protein VG406_30195 [Isosphaeraceae bacterium]|jgi:hypothetical protein|nr:hypothetical protein [Isosphaeraceae bacterium]
MADETEAACLLQKGAQYPRRLGLLGPSGEVFAGFRQGAFALYFGDEPYFHFDLDGRWQRAFVAGIHHVKALDTTIDAIDRPREGVNLVLRRRTLPFAEAGDLDARVRSVALELNDGLGRGHYERLAPPPGVAPITIDELRAFLDRVTLWDASAWFAQRERYLDAYSLPMFIPPDGPNSVVIQGGGTSRDRSFGGAPSTSDHLPTGPALRARRVADLLGRRVALCKRIALVGDDLFGDGGGHVAAMIREASDVFPVTPDSRRRWEARYPDAAARIEAFSAYCDDFQTPPPDAETWAALRTSGLRRVHLAVESGCPAVRALFEKTWDEGRLKAFVAGLKGAGLAASILVLVGAGGEEYDARHVAETVRLIESLDLGPNDFLYLLDAADVAGPEAVARLAELGHPPWIGPSAHDQRERLKTALEPLRNARKVKVLNFTTEKQ